MRLARSVSSQAIKFFLIAATPFSLCACGGLASLFNVHGTYSGTVTGNGQTGQMQLTINLDHSASGTDTISKPGFTTDDSGTVDGSGNMTLTCSYQGVVVAHMTAALEIRDGSLTSKSGTISVVGGKTTPLSLKLSGSISLREPQQ
jgi:hypothetical protein